MTNITCRVCFSWFVLLATTAWADEGLIAHWQLTSNAKESVADRDAINHGVRFENGSAIFDGQRAWLEVPSSKSLKLGTGDFSISVWVHTAQTLDDVLGDVLTCYDAERRQGFTLSLMNYAGTTSGQSNWRNVLFGIDAGHSDRQWTNCGRPGDNHYVKALVVFDGDLYASTWESGAGQRGHVYRYEGGQRWIDCGSPDKCNAINAMAVHQGRLYVGSERYSGGGSSLPLSPNENDGGTVYRYEGGSHWTNVGKIADIRSISGLASFRGKLYAATGTSGAWRDTPRTRGMYRFDGEGKWTSCGCPGLRVVHLHVHNGALYGLSYDDGGFFRYEGGTDWTRLGPVPDTTQVYSAAVYQGDIHVGTWPTGSVFRFGGPQKWTNIGRLGEEKEVMGMAVYNGGLYAGTLPWADVYRYDGGNEWTTTGRLDTTPDVVYRRAWATAVYQGKLYCGVLPSGNVLSFEAGKSVTYDRALPAGWRHLVAVKSGDRLKLYIDGKRVADSTQFDPSRFDVTTPSPLKIGFGQHDYFNGKMKHLKIYDRALSPSEIRGKR